MMTQTEQRALIIEEWPRRLPLRAVDWLMVAVAAVLMVAPLVHLALVYAGLPAEIATDYDAAGVASEYEAKWFLLILAFADVLCTVSVVACNFFPRAINIPPVLLKRPAVTIIGGTRVYLNVTGIACAAFFGYMLECFIVCAQGQPASLSGWAIVGFVAVIFAATAVYFYWLWRGRGVEATSKPRHRTRAQAEHGEVIKEWPMRLPLNALDKILIGVSALLVVLALARVAMVYGALPETIPTHYGMNGVVDSYGDKSNLLVLAGVDVLCWAVVIVFNFFPQTINVPVFLLKRPGEEIIHGTRVLLNVIAILCAALFWYLLEATVAVALGTMAGISSAVMFGFIGVLIASCLGYFIWLWRA